MEKYRDLSRKEKIDIVLKYRVYRQLRNVKARYLIALRNNDIPTIEYFEGMGNDIRKILENTRCFERAKECGFTKLQFNEHGWLEYKIKIVKEIPVCESCIRIAITPSGKYVCGVDHSTGNAGGGWWPSIWDKLHETEKEAELYGLDYLTKRMEYGIENGRTDSCGNYNQKLINKTLREINRLKKPVQLELF